MVDAAVLDERRRAALERAAEPRVEERVPDEQVVAEHEQRRAEEAPEQRVVVSDDRVLDDVREEQEHDQVEGGELRQLPLAREVDQDEEREVDGERPCGLVEDAEVDEARVDEEV